MPAANRRNRAEAADNRSEPRTCEQCGRPLPGSSRPERKYCSTYCRQRAWDDDNPSPMGAKGHPDDGGPWHLTAGGWHTSVPLHWHHDPYSQLWGIPDLGYWRGLGCPPRCDRPVVAPGWSIGIREGREHVGPECPPDFAEQIGSDNWMTVADPADYGAAPTKRKAGKLISIAGHRAVH